MTSAQVDADASNMTFHKRYRTTMTSGKSRSPLSPRCRIAVLLATTITLLLNTPTTNGIGFANPQAQGMLERNQEKLLKEHHSHKHFAKPEDEENKVVKEKSKEYYEGLVSSSLEEPEERVTGDAVLKPTVKFAGSVTVLIAALLLVFLISNGLLFY